MLSGTPETMQAAVLVEPGRMEIEEVPVPHPDADQVRVRLQGCGVCASNLPPFEGQPWFTYPFAPGQLGHEGWGIVDAVGESVDLDLLGMRVSMLSDNAYAEYDVTAAEKAIVLPHELIGHPFPGEPLGCAMNIFERSEVERGQSVAIIGIGFLGALLTQLCAQAGARVIAVGRRQFALDIAGAMGADQLVPMNDHYEIINTVSELTGGVFCDRVIEATGKQWPLDLAAELTRERGRLIIAGYHQDGPRQVNMQLWNWRGLDVINAHEREIECYTSGIARAAEEVAAGRLTPEPLYTHTLPLDQVQAALEMTRDRPDGFMRALIIFPE
jgi:threonine dehydrogenase-like Zn-dependent dehydrogenase